MKLLACHPIALQAGDQNVTAAAPGDRVLFATASQWADRLAEALRIGLWPSAEVAVLEAVAVAFRGSSGRTNSLRQPATYAVVHGLDLGQAGQRRRTALESAQHRSGITWTAVAAIGTAIVLVIDRPDKIFGGIIMMLIGLVMISSALIARRRNQHRRH